MKQQVLFIHGGHAVDRHEEYLENLKNVPLKDIFNDRSGRWHQNLRTTLGSEYEVCTPMMPNSYNATYEEWKIWFERYIAEFHDGVILIGHSLGGIFLAKYLSENVLQIRIKALLLVAAVISYQDRRESGVASFTFDVSELPKVTAQVEIIHIFHSKDDPVVPYEHALKYHEGLHSSTLHTFEDKGHFLNEEFSELVEDIKRL